MTGWTRLGQLVQERREFLRLSQTDVIAAGGPSDYTMRRLERGDPGPYRPSTIRKLELALRWPRGTVDRILNGEEPPAEEAQTDTEIRAAAVIRPGDHVLVAFSRTDITAQDTGEIRRCLQVRFPGVEFTLLSGVSALAVQRGEAS